jgi:hypothetical protein
MRTHIRLAALAAGAAVLATGGTLPTSASATNPVAAPAAHHRPSMPSGIAYLPANVDLQPTASGTWVGTGLQVTLPKAGTYALDLDVRARLQGVPPVNTYMVARLRNVTSGTVVPNSERILSQLIDTTATGAGTIAKNTTSPISERITVTGPTTIQLQAQRTNASGASTIAAIWSDDAGRTSFRFDRIS